MRKFFFELVLLAFAVGLTVEIVRPLIPFLPIMWLLVLCHYTWEALSSEAVSSRARVIKRRLHGRRLMGSYVAVGLAGAALLIFYWWGLNTLLGPKIRSYESEQQARSENRKTIEPEGQLGTKTATESLPSPKAEVKGRPAEMHHPTESPQPPKSPPYVFRDAIELVNDEKNVKVTFLNSSDNPVIDATTQIQWIITDGKLDIATFEPTLSAPQSSGNIPPHGRIACFSKTGKEDMPNSFEELRQGRAVAYVLGQVTYRDLDGNEYQSRFCSQWWPTPNQFPECPKNKFVEGQRLRPKQSHERS